MLANIEARFFSGKTAINLGLCRLFFFSHVSLFLLFYAKKWSLFLDFPDVFYRPSGLFAAFDLIAIGRSSFEIIFYVTLVFNVFSAVGLFGRISFVISFLGFLVINCLPQFFKALVGLNTPILFILLIFCFSRASDAISLDNILLKRKNNRQSDAVYGWPIHYARFLYILFMFLAGLYKLKNSGSDWFLTSNLHHQMLCAPLANGDTAQMAGLGEALNFYFSGLPWLLMPVAAVVFFAEIFTPLVFIGRKMKWIILSILLTMQILSIFLLFVNPFLSFGMYIFWVDWDYVIAKMKSLKTVNPL